MPDARFHTTQWTLVLSAAADDAAAAAALESLCQSYWYPLYAFVRRQGYGASEAEDLTQSFFSRLIEKEYLSQAPLRVLRVNRGAEKYLTAAIAAGQRAGDVKPVALSVLSVSSVVNRFTTEDTERN